MYEGNDRDNHLNSNHNHQGDNEAAHNNREYTGDPTSNSSGQFEETSHDSPYHHGVNKSEQENRAYKDPNRKSKWGSFWSGLAGGFIAAFLVLLLAVYNVIPIGNAGENDGQTANTSHNSNNDSEQVVTTMATDDADKATDLSDASKAVVGVLNMQQQNVWEPSQEVGSGSGIIYKKKDGKAYVVTNAHVVEGASDVKVAFHDKDNTVNAKVLGTDKLSDLAVLEIDGKKVDTVANLANSDNVKVGETVYAIGNPLGMDFANSLTKGIVSGLHRSVDVDTNGDNQPDWVTEVIQTDAAINPGNSGGALVNQKGEVIGINSMKIAKETVEGIGFAIPMDTALPIMKKLETKGEVERPFIGISTAPLEQVPPQYQERIQIPDDIKGGMVIANVEQGSPADKAGLQQFDVITAINGKEVTSILELRKTLYEANVGDTVKLDVYRNGKKQTVSLKLAKQDQRKL
ncbi:trypsin-like peptidase domain-containing protein [Virgibacillus sp. 179-BFC.A HS]|uniref:Trypsin-like peptidase domain-containing protein n=1 Tax=Tigheibacillus jepli TaxID=3035914 RepID=A0ABU5CKT3_9BACI|nr:trypsin-like peptidase domain-containing protein [Virgibacillus sp. 179-BFC.A HS]MDY0406929.1 trypsin-like peptidase domain-containing protein [Virgibacillus sp. 179-BFC.A HS]